ncbi:MAG: DinB family protein [Trueperaceae bacterium]|nr:DinB family protein [Trueperaceae bacterium]
MPYSGSHYSQVFLAHRKALETLLDKLPDDQGEFSSWDGAMSFKTMTDHLTGASLRFAGIASGKATEAFEPSQNFAEAKARLKASTETVVSSLSAMTDEQLSSMVEALGTQMPAFTLVDLLREHEIHHKGQLWMMARMIGIEPGRFIFRG